MLKRCASELIAHKNRLILKQGDGNRSSISGHVATVFGCSGFIGRYLCHRLGQQGTQVVTPYRGEVERVRHLKVMGDLGQIVQLQFDPRDLKSYEEAISTSDTVYNLIGKNYDTKNYKLRETHVDIASKIAEMCKFYKTRLIHVSHISADPNSTSQYFSTKYESEQAVKTIYPDATIVKLSSVFGYEDRFIRRLAWMTGSKLCLVPNKGSTVYRPVNVSDVATGLVQLMKNEDIEGQSFEFYGPRPLTHAQCLELFNETTMRNPYNLNISESMYSLLTEVIDVLPFPWLSIDEVKRLFINETPSGDNHLASMVELKDFELSLVEFARRYRNHANYGTPAPEQIKK